MQSTRVVEVTREQIILTARNFRWGKKMPKWTVIVEGRELPARPLLLLAAGVAPNDPTNSHMAVAKLKALGFETRYDEPLKDDSKSGKARYLDASALVKLYVDEPHSNVRTFVDAQPKPFNTTTLCFAEAFGVFKRKWLAKDMTTDEYLKATHSLMIASWGNEIQVHDYGLVAPFGQTDVDEIVRQHGIDVSDALQLLTLLKGPHSVLVNQSASVLITADRKLATAAAAQGVRVWNCTAEAAPSWA